MPFIAPLPDAAVPRERRHGPAHGRAAGRAEVREGRGGRGGLPGDLRGPLPVDARRHPLRLLHTLPALPDRRAPSRCARAPTPRCASLHLITLDVPSFVSPVRLNARRVARMVHQPVVAAVSKQLLSFASHSKAHLECFPELVGMRVSAGRHAGERADGAAPAHATRARQPLRPHPRSGRSWCCASPMRSCWASSMSSRGRAASTPRTATRSPRGTTSS